MQTHSISRHASTNILHAFDFAKAVGRPLNCYVVICCDEKGAGKTASQICQEVRDRYRAWNLNAAKRYSIDAQPPTYVQTIEDPDGDNPHANWVVHIREALFQEFLQKLPQWLRKSQGDVRHLDISVQMVDPETDKTLAKYVIKGTDEHYTEYFHLGDFAAPQGVIQGRRTCVSPSIGRTARREAGFVPKLHRDDWKRSYVPPKRKPASRRYVNSVDSCVLTANYAGKKAVWEGGSLRSAQKLIQPTEAGSVGGASGPVLGQ